MFRAFAKEGGRAIAYSGATLMGAEAFSCQPFDFDAPEIMLIVGTFIFLASLNNKKTQVS